MEDEGSISGQYKMTFNGPQCHTEVHILRHSIDHDGVDEVPEIKDPPDEVSCWFDKNDGQGGLACCSSWGHKESDMTERLN